MSEMKVTLERLTVHPHPNADRLELARVGLYYAVVGKGQFETGDLGVYVPEQAILPDELIEKLGLTGKLAGKARNRVKAVRLRGEVSQGIVIDPFSVDLGMTADEIGDAFGDRHDFAEKLGIAKWVPDIPPQMAGVAISGANLLKWIDIENLQRHPDVFTLGEPVIATEKIHGTCMIATLVRDGEFLVSSKGLAQNGIALAENYDNLYWRAAAQYGIRERLQRALDECPDELRVAVYGEVYGVGVQDLHYGANARQEGQIGFRAFDMRFETNTGNKWWVEPINFVGVCARYEFPTVPVLYSGPFDMVQLDRVRSGRSTIGGDNIREGVVIRPLMERTSDELGGRLIVKYVSSEYLTRGGDATEYE